MSNGLYDKARQSFASKQIDWTSDTIKVVLADTTLYTVNKATDQFLSDIASGARIATSASMTSRTATAGVLDADDTLISAVTGTNLVAVIFLDTGTPSTSRLIAYIDTGTGIPASSAGGDVTVSWDNGSNKIAKL